jgi:predicted lipoprotein with Yx(FWY)xxD motif
VKRAVATLCLLLALVITGVGCGGSDDDTADLPSELSTQSTTQTVDSQEEPDRPKKGSWGVVFAAYSVNHEILLFDLSGHTLYRFDKDKGSTSSCYGTCAKSWPPALTEGKARGVDVSRKLIGTTKRKDGTIQLTFAGHPLYTRSGERGGRITGNGVTAFGGEWHALRRTGEDLPG